MLQFYYFLVQMNDMTVCPLAEGKYQTLIAIVWNAINAPLLWWKQTQLYRVMLHRITKKLKWIHNQISLKAGSICWPFNCTSKTVTGTFAMWRGRKLPACWNSKIFFMLNQIAKIKSVFVLTCSPIRKVNNFFNFVCEFFLLFPWNKCTATVLCFKQS